MLKDKVALVTGASSGIGRAIALAWAREGAKVVVSDVNAQGGEETAALVRAAGGDALFVACDVGSAADCEALVNRAVAHYGRLDVACNNAGIGGDLAPTADQTVQGWQRVAGSGVGHVGDPEAGLAAGGLDERDGLFAATRGRREVRHQHLGAGLRVGQRDGASDAR